VKIGANEIELLAMALTDTSVKNPNVKELAMCAAAAQLLAMLMDRSSVEIEMHQPAAFGPGSIKPS
jgi:hypothetical protein